MWFISGDLVLIARDFTTAVRRVPLSSTRETANERSCERGAQLRRPSGKTPAHATSTSAPERAAQKL